MYGLTDLFGTDGFVPRRSCGSWTPFHVAVHNTSDLIIWLSYIAIPAFLVYVAVHRKPGRLTKIFWLFGAFIVSCGFTHFMEFLMFYWPAYYLAAAVKVFCAIISGSTVIVLARMVPMVKNLKTVSEMNIAIEEAVKPLVASNERKDEFLATLGHELRNPLAAISNIVQIIRTPNVPREVVLAQKEVLARQVEHVNRLVDDIMEITRATQGRMSLKLGEIRFDEVVERAVLLVEQAAKAKGHRIQVDKPPSNVRIIGDKIRLVQVVSNLLSNAVKYTPAGGRVSLQYGVTGDELVVVVSDNGIGIPPENLGHIFDLCYRTKRARKMENGLGIGLTMARSIVEQHGGSIEASSAGPDKGSTFTVRLPARRSGDENPLG